MPSNEIKSSVKRLNDDSNNTNACDVNLFLFFIFKIRK